MTHAPELAENSKESGRTSPRWAAVLQDWKAVAWPMIAALVAAFLHFLGYVATKGRTTALGTYSLDQPPISQEYLVAGAVVLAQLGLLTAICISLLLVLRMSLRRLISLLPSRFHLWVSTHRRRDAYGFLVFAAAAATLIAGMSFTNDLTRKADTMILMSPDQIGTAWMRMVLADDPGWEMAYHFFLAATITLFITLSWWVLKNVKISRVGRVAYGTWAILEVINLMTGFAFIYGVTLTFRDYPVVGFSNEEQLAGKNYLPILIGSDDKLYALLMLPDPKIKVQESAELRRMILYVPRTEVKWMFVLRNMRLHLAAHIQDMKADSDLPPPGQP